MKCQDIRSRAKIFSEQQISEIRGALSQLELGPDTAVIVVGSLARREASEQSDLDYFMVTTLDDDAGVRARISEAVEALGLRAPSPTGAFAKSVTATDFLDAIGGSGESNDELTRRMLFLLESDWLFGEDLFESLLDGVIERYIKDGITQHQLARFFLNDLIRYYRTICVDFEYKTNTTGKSWGDRSIKLMFSRKFLYFSGVIAAAETVQSACGFKRTELRRLLRMSPSERVMHVCGADADKVIARYDQFLDWMSNSETRDLLRSTTVDRKLHMDKFREIKNAGHHFSWALESLLHRTYAPTHPIYQALLF